MRFRIVTAGVGLLACALLLGCGAREKGEPPASGDAPATAGTQPTTTPTISEPDDTAESNVFNRAARRADYADVAGRITLDGQPLAEGSITFVPLDGKGSAAGSTNKEGRYSVRIPPGKYKVEIRRAVVIGKKKTYDQPDSPDQLIGKEVVPPRYNTQTQLTAEVKPGENAINFDLASR